MHSKTGEPSSLLDRTRGVCITMTVILNRYSLDFKRGGRTVHTATFTNRATTQQAVFLWLNSDVLPEHGHRYE